MKPGLPFDYSCAERQLNIGTADGVMPIFVAQPLDTGRWPAVVFVMDAVGVREELRDMARYIASQGYLCVMPNLYYRDGGPSFDPHEPFRERDRFMPLAEKLSRERVLSDIGAVLEWAGADPHVAPGPKGCIGFCMGGRFVVWAAAEFADFRAAASLFGPKLVTADPNSPHRLVAQIGGELFFGFGAADQFIPPSDIEALEAALVEAGADYRIEVYPAAEHAFIFPKRWCYQAKASEKAWRSTLGLLARQLQSNDRSERE